MMKSNIVKISLLILAFLVYSLSSVFCKLASQNEMLGFWYLFYFGCVIFMLGTYAILWQKVLSFLPLNKAFLCKSITILMILCVSHFLFNEAISTNNLIGTAFIISGIIALSWKK